MQLYMASTQHGTPFTQDWNQIQYAAYMFYITLCTPCSKNNGKHILQLLHTGMFQYWRIQQYSFCTCMSNSGIFRRSTTWQYCLIAKNNTDTKMCSSIAQHCVVVFRTSHMPFPQQNPFSKTYCSYTNNDCMHVVLKILFHSTFKSILRLICIQKCIMDTPQCNWCVQYCMSHSLAGWLFKCS